MNNAPAAKPLPKILSYDDYLRQQRETAAEREAALRDRQKELYQAQYYLAFEPEYYARLAPPPKPKTQAAAAAAMVPAIDELTDHNYDGIQEYDNPTPGWWYGVFGATIAFSVLYIFVYHLSTLVPPLPERHARIEAKALERRFAELNTIPMGEEKLIAIMETPQWLARGETIFQQSCALCHQADASGNIGPNLTDELYRNVTALADIPNLVAEGIGNGAMPAQKNLMNDNEIALVSAYVASPPAKPSTPTTPDSPSPPGPPPPEPAAAPPPASRSTTDPRTTTIGAAP